MNISLHKMEQLKTSCSPWTFGAIGYTLDGCPLIFGTFWWPTSAKNSKKTSNSRFVLLIIDWKCLTHCYYENPILFWLCSLKDSSFFLKLFLACVCYLKFKKNAYSHLRNNYNLRANYFYHTISCVENKGLNQ